MKKAIVCVRNFALLVSILSFSTTPVSAQISPKPLPLSEAQLASYRNDLHSPSQNAKEVALITLGLARDTASVKQIAALLGEPWQLRPAVAWSLGHIRGKAALAALLERAASPDYGRYVIPALGDLGDTAAVQPLIELLQNSDVHGRAAAAGALGTLGQARAIDALLPLLDDRGVATLVTIEGITWNGDKATVAPGTLFSGVAVRSAALDALVQLNNRRALAPVEARLATETDEKFRASLSVAVEKLKLAPVPKPPVKAKPAVKPKAPIKRK